MADIQPVLEVSNAPYNGPPQNRVLPFQVDGLDVRGKAFTFSTEFDSIVSRHDYPNVISRALGEAVALAAVLGTSLKFDGKFILQTQTDGVVDLMVVEFRTPSAIRAYVRFDKDALSDAEKRGETEPHQLLGKGTLAMTIDQGAHMQRYQGIVALDGSTLEEVAHQYFLQSEQIPTVMRLAVGQLFSADSDAPSWRIGGLMAQFLPQSEDRMRLRDLPGGDGAEEDQSDEDDAWNAARALVDTVEDDELLDPAISSERLLFRLFNQHDIRVYDEVSIEDKCSCSRERIQSVLDNLDESERADIMVDGKIEVNCEFCSKSYIFEAAA